MPTEQVTQRQLGVIITELLNKQKVIDVTITGAYVIIELENKTEIEIRIRQDAWDTDYLEGLVCGPDRSFKSRPRKERV